MLTNKILSVIMLINGGDFVKKEIVFNIEDDIIERFELAVNIKKCDRNTIIEEFMKEMIITTFSGIAKEYANEDVDDEKAKNENTVAKALKKIPLWAEKQTQIPYKIIRAFFQLEDEKEVVFFSELKQRCSNEKKHYDTYVKTFDSNFVQLKFDGAKSHGKVFEINENRVKLWSGVDKAIRSRKNQFLEKHTTDIGYINFNGQKNLGRSGRLGTDYGQYFYNVMCTKCGKHYEANGSDLFIKKCPNCQGGADSGERG